jgi:hypothetical protein
MKIGRGTEMQIARHDQRDIGDALRVIPVEQRGEEAYQPRSIACR